MKPAYGEVKCLCGANSVDCHVQERVWMIARTVESGEQVMKPWIDYYVIVFSMVTEDPEWHGNLPNLWRGRMCDDMVKQLYACSSVAIWTETETELTCDTERNNDGVQHLSSFARFLVLDLFISCSLVISDQNRRHLPFVNVCFSQTMKAMTKNSFILINQFVFCFSSYPNTTLPLLPTLIQIILTMFSKLTLFITVSMAVFATAIPTPGETNSILNSCNARAYSVLYTLIYWLHYLELLQHWGLFSALCTYLLVTLTWTLAMPGPIQWRMHLFIGYLCCAYLCF